MTTVTYESPSSEQPDIDWGRLTEQGRLTLLMIAIPISHGYTITEIAERHGIPRPLIVKALRELRKELRP